VRLLRSGPPDQALQSRYRRHTLALLKWLLAAGKNAAAASDAGVMRVGSPLIGGVEEDSAREQA
jgi:hypothetical protein